MATNYNNQLINKVIELKKAGVTHRDISEEVFGKRTAASSVWTILNEHYYPTLVDILADAIVDKMHEGEDGSDLADTTFATETNCKILVCDIETSPLVTYTFNRWNTNIADNQIVDDWYIMAFAAKWLGEGEVMYCDTQGKGSNDKDLLVELHKLLDQADIVIGHNFKSFDSKKINARFILNGLKPTKPYRIIDTLTIAKSCASFTSNKLSYLTEKLCTTYKKSSHSKFAGLELWKECLKDNPEAWLEMQEYNSYDILSNEELFLKLAPFAKGLPNLDAYEANHEVTNTCYCGNQEWEVNGMVTTNQSRYLNFTCTQCGTHKRGKENQLTKFKRATFKV